MPKGLRPPTLQAHEEEEILNHILNKAKRGEPVLRTEIIGKVVKFIQSDQRKNPFKNGSPGNKWFSLFRRRHNDKFCELDSESLRVLEKVGFTTTVLNTLVYPRPPYLIKGDSAMVPVKRPPGRPRVHPLQYSTPKAVTPTPDAVMDSPRTGSDESFITSPTDDDTGKSQDSQGDTPDFQSGSKLEVMDFNGQWYPVKVVEVDYEEGEVLVHFEKWSDRYDEWVRMDSNRIRRPVLAQTPSSKKSFVQGEQVIAVWTYNHKYPATVKEVLDNDKYEVLFCDGYCKVLRGCKLFKATPEDIKNVKLPPPKKPAPPMGADPLDPDLGPKEERRLKKQRLDVLQAYRPHKRQRLESPSTPEISPQITTPAPKLAETPKVVLRMRGRPPKKPREIATEKDAEEEEENKWVYEDDDEDHEVESEHEAAPEVIRAGERKGVRGRRRKKRRPFDESTYFYRGPKHRQGHEEDKERWNTEVPEGVAPVLIKDNEGYFRESIIIPDRKMPSGWTKHTMRRKSGAKWDVFLVKDEHSNGKKVDPDPRRVKTMLPKGRLADGLDNGQAGSDSSPALTSPPFPLAELRTPDGGFTCCGKNFRKENLFQMHMKHYHPEYSNLFGSTPNMADLAYARTVGEPLEDSRAEAMTPRNTLMERVTKYEAERKALSDQSAASAKPLLNGIIDEPEKKVEPIVKKAEAEPTKECDKKEEESNIEKDEVKEGKLVDAPGEKQELAKSSDNKNEENLDKTQAEHIPSDDDLILEYSEDTDIEEEAEATKEADVKEEPTPAPPTTISDPPETQPPPCSIQPPATATSTIPVIRPVSKMAAPAGVNASPSDSPISSSKVPTIITRIVPPGQKPPSSTTKLHITVTSPAAAEKEVKSTIKTMLPMRPPATEPKETPELQKPKEQKPKEEGQEENPVKTRPRKRAVSETLPKKPKLVKPSTGSLEEPTAEKVERTPSPSCSGSSYHRFSRNRSQIPRVSLEKLKITPDSNGSSVAPTATPAPALPTDEPLPQPAELAPPTDIVYENLRKEEIINCTCGYPEEDGLMIQCDLCLCWQHGLCNNIDKEVDVPEKYVCYICQHPAKERKSLHYLHNQDWLKEGTLPTLSFVPHNNEVQSQRESMLKRSHDLTSSLLQIGTVIHSLRIKAQIAKKSDHPKLYLWAKSWKSGSPGTKQAEEEEVVSKEGVSLTGPQPEAAIDETECRLRLLEHVEDYQQQVDDRLTSIQAQIAALESEDPDVASDEGDHYSTTKQTLQMLLRDLDTLGKVAAIN